MVAPNVGGVGPIAVGFEGRVGGARASAGPDYIVSNHLILFLIIGSG